MTGPGAACRRPRRQAGEADGRDMTMRTFLVVAHVGEEVNDRR